MKYQYLLILSEFEANCNDTDVINISALETETGVHDRESNPVCDATRLLNMLHEALMQPWYEKIGRFLTRP